jgi:hypothetical protein
MAITPDTKDWTWVLARPCPECGFDAAGIRPTGVAEALRSNAASWQEVLLRPDVRDRPDDATWSPLEYACHVRDVFRISRTRIESMLTTHDPLFANWDQDETALADRYAEQDPAVVGAGITPAAEALAAMLEGVRGDDWERPGRRSDGAAFTVGSLAVYVLHDPVHHLADVTRGEPGARAARL